MTRFDPHTYPGLDRLGRIRLSDSFHMREFLFSEIAVHYGIRNVPAKDGVDQAVQAGSSLCQLLLEPLQRTFGRLHVRSGYRSREVNGAGVGKHSCAADNDGFHVWDFPSAKNGLGATACISVPSISRAVLAGEIAYEAIAWWIHDLLEDWSHVEFFATSPHSEEVCFNIGWHQTPLKEMTTRRGSPRDLLKLLPAVSERAAMSQSLLNVCGK